MNSQAIQIVGMGTIVVDEQMFVDDIPSEDSKEKATSRRQQIGGPVPTALVLLQRFGHACHLISPWGDDFNGAGIEHDLRSEGLSFSSACRIEGQRSGGAHVWIHNTNGSRTIVSAPCEWHGLVLTDTDREHLRRCRLLHLDGAGDEVAIESAKLVRSHGGLVTVDAGSPKVATAALMSICNVFVFPERFVQQYFGHRDLNAAGQQILQQGVSFAVCTRGEQGAILFHDDQVCHVPAFSTETIDSNGAGDVFSGGLIAGLLSGLSPVECVQSGAAAAAIKCRGVGNRDALPALHEVRELVETAA